MFTSFRNYYKSRYSILLPLIMLKPPQLLLQKLTYYMTMIMNVVISTT